jgi:hypothetical protein
LQGCHSGFLIDFPGNDYRQWCGVWQWCITGQLVGQLGEGCWDLAKRVLYFGSGLRSIIQDAACKIRAALGSGIVKE